MAKIKQVKHLVGQAVPPKTNGAAGRAIEEIMEAQGWPMDRRGQGIDVPAYGFEVKSRDLDFKTQNISLSGQLIQHLVVAIIGGIIMAFPIILYEIWLFVRPALQDTERKKTTGIVLVSSFLFFVGVLFGYFGLTPLSVNFLFNYSVSSKIVNNVTLESYISFVTMMTLATGLVFELPLMIYFLARLGLVTPALLRKYRKHSLIVTLVLAAVITPPDVASQVLMSIPIYILYEIGILVADRVEKGKNTINIIND